MEIIRDLTCMQRLAEAWRREGKTIGLVPTMGYFHEGHLSLMRHAHGECDVVVVSLFVNPTQFGPHEDLQGYPRDFQRDAQLAEQQRVEVLFAPAAEELYAGRHTTLVEVKRLSEVLCGVSRPSHFRGVATVCAKLFNLCKPHRVYFGAKDYQQTVIVERMARDLNFDLEFVRCPTVRESDGLAMSSRNAYLTTAERSAALVLSRSLSEAQKLVAGGARDARWLREQVRMMIESEPLAQLDYAEVVDACTLEPVDEVSGPTLIAVAARFGRARLIDNVVVGVDV